MLMLVGLMYPQTALSKSEKIWKNGDIIASKVICKTEDAILELTNADMKGPESNVMVVITDLVENRQCTAFPFPLRFLVTKALVHYKDHKKIPSVILGVNAGNGDWVGWLIATGRYRESGI